MGLLGYGNQNEKDRLISEAKVRLSNAETYEDWLTHAKQLDLLLGNDQWKRDPESDYYDWRLIQRKLVELKQARKQGDLKKLLFIIKTTWARNPGNMGNLKLYSHSYTGTKDLVEEYILECQRALDDIVSAPSSVSQDREILETLHQTQQGFGRTALLLSGGGTMGMLHTGVLVALIEADLLPRIISGSSAGAIVASVVCTKTRTEIYEAMSNFVDTNLNAFEITGAEESLFTRLARFLKHGAWIDISYLSNIMEGLVGDLTFQEAYNRSRRVLNITVSSAGIYEVPRLLNYLTAPNVLIRSAVCCSCSLPLVFSSHNLLAKDPVTNELVQWSPSPQKFVDGSVDNDLPLARLSEMFNVDHFIVSQVNPHVVPFLRDSEEQTSPRGLFGVFKRPLRDLYSLLAEEIMHDSGILAEAGIMPNLFTKLKSVVTQKYSGDITILPEIKRRELGRILKNPTKEFMIDTRMRGLRATWPLLSIIKNHCAVELSLDNTINIVRARLLFVHNVRYMIGSRPVSITLNSSCDANSAPSSVLKKRKSHVELSSKLGATSSGKPTDAPYTPITAKRSFTISETDKAAFYNASNSKSHPGSPRAERRVTISAGGAKHHSPRRRGSATELQMRFTTTNKPGTVYPLTTASSHKLSISNKEDSQLSMISSQSEEEIVDAEPTELNYENASPSYYFQYDHDNM
ncbi:hypothetical protein CANCADRAFT_31211 [Tortispora caseinolytica NRRL Y-17796]|uniref:Patatin-like phospholipase domain-containing protein n=1 Tax=Tortispora caseinolytica NRRL Y-17796 TaxID=767744 RepID=A0A1E4TEN6_9ASCO|nr:hypothetical protein CANCADRAFT_31211 [Tortispora caseinolytica NRRL Y-17796]